MNVQINRILNAIAVHIDDRQHWATLADYICSKEGFTVMEIRWNLGAKQGTIITDSIDRTRNWIDVIKDISEIVTEYKKEHNL